MKALFYFGLLGLALFEILKVYFIMPMPGSQDMNSIDWAYFLYSFRWFFRFAFLIIIAAGLPGILKSNRKWIAAIALIFTAVIAYLFNMKISADKMFLQPQSLTFKSKAANELPGMRLIIAVENKGEAKAFPVEFLTYHHQVRDVIGGKPLMVTYCSVCRTGRVYEPLVNGREEQFRLVGMDHFNAMFEDNSTKSWWRQATGEAITGKMKGNKLPEFESRQMTIDKFFELFPEGTVMQPDEFSISNYDSLARFEQGRSKGSLTRTDSISWQDKSWVIGICIGSACKAYDWKMLESKHIINDSIGSQMIALALAGDGKSFVAFENSTGQNLMIHNDTIFSENGIFDFAGRNLTFPTKNLKTINAYQEFWHSWRTFHPGSLVVSR